MIQKTKRIKKGRSLRAVFFFACFGVLVLIGIGFLVVSNWKIHQKRTELVSRIETLKREIQILEEKNQELQAGIFQSQSEENLEKAAREQFGLKKPGEEVVVIKKETEEEIKKDEEKSFWDPKAWWERIKSKTPFRNF